MVIGKKVLIKGAWWQYRLECPNCKAHTNVACPRGDEAVVAENPCPSGCDRKKPPKLVVKAVKEDGVDKRKLSVKSPKRQSSKTRKRTTKKDKV